LPHKTPRLRERAWPAWQKTALHFAAKPRSFIPMNTTDHAWIDSLFASIDAMDTRRFVGHLRGRPGQRVPHLRRRLAAVRRR